MAERRMFAKTIVTSDAFLDMPATTRCLYFTLAMFADDDGFVNSPKSIMRQSGASEDDLKILFTKRYILGFDSGVIVIKHWKIHNLIQKDRYKETTYLEEKAQLVLDDKKAYTEAISKKETPCIQSVSKTETQVSIGKDSIGKDSIVAASAHARDGRPQQPDLSDISEEEDDMDYDDPESKLEPWGKDKVVYLTEGQAGDLLDKLGLATFDYYIAKLSDFIVKKGANVQNHYKTILKWYKEDTRV